MGAGRRGRRRHRDADAAERQIGREGTAPADAGAAFDARADARADAVTGRVDGAAGDPVCPLCGRPIPPEAHQSLHHLVPKLKGGRGGPTVLLHQICHNEIHAALSEAELARCYASIGALLGHPRIARFVAWVKDKPPAFHSRSAGGRRKRR